MRIHFISADSTEVLLGREELAALGIGSAEHLSMTDAAFAELIDRIFRALEHLCGLRREGNYAAVECRPYLSGGCRLEIRFTRSLSPRAYIFDTADDMFDAVNLLRRNSYFNTFDANIQPLSDKFFMYIPHPDLLTDHHLAILSEYSL